MCVPQARMRERAPLPSYKDGAMQFLKRFRAKLHERGWHKWKYEDVFDPTPGLHRPRATQRRTCVFEGCGVSQLQITRFGITDVEHKWVEDR